MSWSSVGALLTGCGALLAGLAAFDRSRREARRERLDHGEPTGPSSRLLVIAAAVLAVLAVLVYCFA